MKKCLDRFLNYITFDTQSNEESTTFPSTDKQLLLLEHLKNECLAMGIDKEYVHMDTNGYVYIHLPANTTQNTPAIGFIAHVDTSGDCSGKGVNARVISNYDGKPVLLGENSGLILSTEQFPALCDYIGEDIVVTDGTTLLGADDKAGVAAIMTTIETIFYATNLHHGDLYFAFTPDEEVGRGMQHFDQTFFKAAFAYTVDGGRIGELEYESFNAARAAISIKGTSVHPGYAKGVLINAVLLATDLIANLPSGQRPETTEGYEGYFHVAKMKGSVEEATISILIRDFDKKSFDLRKNTINDVVNTLNQQYGGCITCTIRDEYLNMRTCIEPVMEIVALAENAMKTLHITPIIRPIRGGTDGSQLSYMGIPCPNLFAGGHNFHGPYEFLPVKSLEASKDVLLTIIQNAVGLQLTTARVEIQS